MLVAVYTIDRAIDAEGAGQADRFASYIVIEGQTDNLRYLLL